MARSEHERVLCLLKSSRKRLVDDRGPFERELTGVADHSRRNSAASTREEAKRVNYGPLRGFGTILSN